MRNSVEASRKEVRTAIKKRGRRKYDVWTGYASKGNFYFTLDGSPNCLHLIWMEGDPAVISYTIPTEKQIGSALEGPQGSVPDAICIMRSGNVEWREVKVEQDSEKLSSAHTDQILAQTSAAEREKAYWRLISTKDLKKHQLLIRNWRQGLSYIWAALHYDLDPYKKKVELIVGREGSCTIAQILSAFQPSIEPLLLAAVFRMIQSGVLESDLAAQPFGLATRIQNGQAI